VDDPAQIFAKVSPAIAFIQTATGSGSGVLIEGGYIVTNAHVVWPFDAARVVFPDGSAFNQVPVKGWDLLVDLAVLGPINAPASPATLRSGENIPIGSDIYLLGYPGEVEALPQPTITQGILSRLPQWELEGITYFQTDAAITGGQSGGALASETGDVIGISVFKFQGTFGLHLSSGDLLPRIRQIIAGQDPSRLGERRLPLEGGAVRHELALRNFWDDIAFVINEGAGTEIEIELTGDKDGGINVYNPFGRKLLDLDKTVTGAEVGSFVTRVHAPHFLLVRQYVETPAEFTLTANRRLIPFSDPDRGRRIRVGEPVRGNLYFRGDTDHFLLQLEENETVEIVVRSAMVDSYLTIDYLGAAAGQVVHNDDSGGGLFRQDAKIVCRAPHSGTFFVVVRDRWVPGPGGYVINVNRT